MASRGSSPTMGSSGMPASRPASSGREVKIIAMRSGLRRPGDKGVEGLGVEPLHVREATDHGLPRAAPHGQQRLGPQCPARNRSDGEEVCSPERDAQGVALPRRIWLHGPSRNGSSARCTAENDNCASDSTPAGPRDPHPGCGGRVVEQRRCLPMPASPTSTSAPLGALLRAERDECVKRVPLGCAAQQGNRVLRDAPHASGMHPEHGVISAETCRPQTARGAHGKGPRGNTAG